MDRVITIDQYPQILTNYLRKLADERNTALGNTFEYQVIADVPGGHFQLICMGWSGYKFIYQVLIHFDLKPNGKVWVQQNNTEILLDKDLGELGIAKTNIVPGFRPEGMREMGDLRG
ncbi:MAG: XisI protein [Haliscomenobacter sp.]|nr:element excision factor XisI family protein [Haliscomenobacter sp.]MBK9488605.1 XisI protein [Haliscomenobacter sp.]